MNEQILLIIIAVMAGACLIFAFAFYSLAKNKQSTSDNSNIVRDGKLQVDVNFNQQIPFTPVPNGFMPMPVNNGQNYAQSPIISVNGHNAVTDEEMAAISAAIKMYESEMASMNTSAHYESISESNNSNNSNAQDTVNATKDTKRNTGLKNQWIATARHESQKRL